MSLHNPWIRRLISPAIRRGRAFSRDERGVTVVEFALLALPFFTIIFAILETAMVFFAAQILDSAVHDASRLIRTGQAQTAGYTADNFRTEICDSLFGIFDCSKVKIKVSIVTDFASATVASPLSTTCTTTCDWTISETFIPGTGKQIVMVQAYYKWPLTIDFPWFSLKNQPDNFRLLAGLRVFRNEPF